MIDFAFQSLILAFVKKKSDMELTEFFLWVLSFVVPKIFQSSLVLNEQERFYSLVIRVRAWAEKDEILGMNGVG